MQLYKIDALQRTCIREETCPFRIYRNNFKGGCSLARPPVNLQACSPLSNFTTAPGQSTGTKPLRGKVAAASRLQGRGKKSTVVRYLRVQRANYIIKKKFKVCVGLSRLYLLLGFQPLQFTYVFAFPVFSPSDLVAESIVSTREDTELSALFFVSRNSTHQQQLVIIR